MLCNYISLQCFCTSCSNIPFNHAQYSCLVVPNKKKIMLSFLDATIMYVPLKFLEMFGKKRLLEITVSIN